MRIGIDARTILNPEKGEDIGIGHYTYQLLRYLLKNDKENQYVIFFDSRVREKDVRKFDQANTKIVFYPYSDYKQYLPGVYNEILGAATISKEKLDVLHNTSSFNRIPTSYRGKIVVTFHDMGIYRVPECYPTAKRFRAKTIFSLMAKKADRIIAVSDSVKQDIKKYCGVSESAITTIYSGLDERFFEDTNKNSEKVLEKFGIRKKYILFLGTLEPSKNIVRMLEAFKIFRNKNKSQFDYQLVLAGKRGWLSQEYPRIIKDLGVGKDVIFTGYVVGDELVPLFKRAEFFLMPSLYEGFGMTLLEAFATGTPSIISEISSLPEIAKDAALYVNPLDVSKIAEAMAQLAGHEELRNELKRKGLQRAKEFSWNECAKQTLEIYLGLV